MAAGVKFIPSKLSSISIRKVVERIEIHADNLDKLPCEVKDKILYLMSKRGAFTDSNIKKILHPNVINLDLSESELSDEGLKEVCKCKALRKLDLNAGKGFRTNISSGAIKSVAVSCKYLEVVFLRRCELMDDLAVSYLAENCRNLLQLNLEGCPNITDKGVRCIAENSTKLESLNLSRTQVSDKGLEFLSNGICAKSLFELHVSSCNNITDDGIELLVNLCPNLKILIFHGCPLTTDRSRENIEFLRRNMKQLSWTVY